MKRSTPIPRILCLAAAFLALWAGSVRAQFAPVIQSYTNTFDAGGNTSVFVGGSVASWLYWYGLGYNNVAMTNDPTMDVNGDATSGSLQVYLPFGASGDQGVFFGTFDNQYGYDGSVTIDARNFTGLAFDIHFDPSTPLSAAGDLGSITMSIFPAWENGGDFGLFPSVSIPATATNGWYHAQVSITNFLANEKLAGLTNCAGIGFDYNSYSGYPTNPVTFWIDNVTVIAGPQPAPNYTNSFPAGGNTSLFTGGSVASWLYWYGLGYNNVAMTNDPATDAGGDATSGSLQVYLPFGASGDQGVFFGTFDNKYGYDGSVAIDARQYASLAFDIHFDPNTPLNAAGNLGAITMSIFPAWENGGDFSLFPSVTIPATATNGWFHATESLTNFIANEKLAGLTNCAGIGFDYNSYSGYPTNPVTFWIDNVAVVAAGLVTTSPPVPPPAITLSPATPGLLTVASAPGAQYQRQDIETVNANYSWIGVATPAHPVTYSVTIGQYPGKDSANFQSQIFLIPSPGSESGPDYNEPNVIFLNLNNNSDGTMSATFRYKTNEPNGNTMIYNNNPSVPTQLATGIGTLAAITSTNPLGTWGLTFNSDTNITMFGPGVSTNFNLISEDAAQLFVNPMNMYIGSQPNSLGNIGESVLFTGAAVSGLGASVDINDNFAADTNLDANTWTVNAQDPNGVFIVPPTSKFWVTWPASPASFFLTSSTNLALGTNGWTASSLVPAQLGPNNQLLFDATNLTSSALFFELAKTNSP